MKRSSCDDAYYIWKLASPVAYPRVVYCISSFSRWQKSQNLFPSFFLSFLHSFFLFFFSNIPYSFPLEFLSFPPNSRCCFKSLITYFLTFLYILSQPRSCRRILFCQREMLSRSYHRRIKIRKDVANLIGKKGKERKYERRKSKDEERRSDSDLWKKFLHVECCILFSLSLYETRKCYYQIFYRSVQQL